MNPVDELLDLMHEAIEAAGLSRAEVARRMGVTPAYVSMVLSGTKNPTIDWLRRMWVAIGADPGVSVTGRGRIRQ